MGDLTYVDQDGHSRCTHCGVVTDENHNFCPACGSPLKSYSYGEGNATNLSDSDATVYPPGHVSSSGRDPWGNMSMAEQRAYLDGEPPSFSRDGGGDFLHRLGAADELVERCEADLEEAAESMRMGNAFLRDEHLHERAASLSPDDRSAYVELLNRRARWQAAQEALDRARAQQAALLRTYEQIAVPIDQAGPSRTSVFRPKRPGLVDPDDWN
ncbi:MAG TPA: zinc-ribbon domain-containing protein [Streptosporangiaceae bacterium]|jgi:hypothetical protein